MRVSGKALVAFGFLWFVGCATAPPPAPAPKVEATEGDGLINQIVDLDTELEETALQTARETEEKPSTVNEYPKLLVEVNEDVRRWIQYFTEKDAERFTRFLKRGYPYRKMVQAILKEKGVPEEFYYLAMIESGYAAHARSVASAVGIWQFVSGTSSRYGIRTNSYVDERRDPVRATYAAAEYLRDLHNIFGSWHLAMAAYNAGEIRILRAIMRAKTRDFWELVEKRALPEETMNYVPKFLAAMIIGKNPTRFGLESPEGGEEFPPIESAEVPSPVSLKHVAVVSRIDLVTLESLNPHLVRGITPPNRSTYAIWVPKGTSRSVAAATAILQNQRIRGRWTLPPEPTLAQAKYHRTKRGEKLRAIARTTRAKRTVRHYKVRRGDTLDGIADRFGLTVSQLKNINRLRRNIIYAGQVLKVARL